MKIKRIKRNKVLLFTHIYAMKINLPKYTYFKIGLKKTYI